MWIKISSVYFSAKQPGHSASHSSVHNNNRARQLPPPQQREAVGATVQIDEQQPAVRGAEGREQHPAQSGTEGRHQYPAQLGAEGNLPPFSVDVKDRSDHVPVFAQKKVT